MDQNFQTSFIPKKPIVVERNTGSKPVGLFTVVSIIIFLTMVLAFGGLYFYKNSVSANIAQMAKDLELAKNRFEPDKITQLQTLDKRLRASVDVLGNHVAVSPIFETLEELTMKTVRYTKFGYEVAAGRDAKIVVKLSGQAIGYRSVALQADIFSKRNRNLIDPVFSNLSLDDKGNVLFDLTFSVDPTFVDYKQSILLEEQQVVIPPPATTEETITTEEESGINNTEQTPGPNPTN